MKKKTAAIWVGLAMVFGFFVMVSEEIPPAGAAVITVDDSGGADHLTIQDAINASNDGDTIRVYDGTYHENVLVNKRISLIGNGSETTIIDGGLKDHQNVVTIITDGVNMSGFGIINFYMGHEFGGIFTQA